MKKRLLQTTFLCIYAIFSYGQSIDIVYDSIYTEMDIIEGDEAISYSDVIHNYEQKNSYEWLLEDDMPNEWQAQLCLNPISCFSFEKRDGNIAFDPFATYEYALHVFHNNTPGTGYFNFSLSDAVDSTIVYDQLYNIIRITDRTSTKEYNDNIRVFPTVTNDVVNINNISSIQSVKLLDMNGMIVEEISKAYKNEIVLDISRFHKGIYILLVESTSGFQYSVKIIRL